MDAPEPFGVIEFHLAYDIQLLKKRIQRIAFAGTQHPMQAVVEQIVAPSPRSADASRRLVHFKEFHIKAVHGRIAAGAQSCYAGTDNDYVLAHNPTPFLSRMYAKSQSSYFSGTGNLICHIHYIG